MFEEGCSDEGDENGDDIYGKLELDEFSDGVVDVAAPHDCLDDGGEIVIKEDDICGLFRNLGACDAHCEAYIGFF